MMYWMTHYKIMIDHKISVGESGFWIITANIVDTDQSIFTNQTLHFKRLQTKNKWRDGKISFKRFSENKYVLAQISASTGHGDFNNSTNVTYTQIQLMMLLWRPLAPGILFLSCGMPAPIECLQLTHAYCSISGQKSRWILMSFTTNLSFLMCGDVNIFYTINCGNYGVSCYHVWLSKTRYSLPVSKHLLRPPLDILSTCGMT